MDVRSVQRAQLLARPWHAAQPGGSGRSQLCGTRNRPLAPSLTLPIPPETGCLRGYRAASSPPVSSSCALLRSPAPDCGCVLRISFPISRLPGLAQVVEGVWWTGNGNCRALPVSPAAQRQGSAGPRHVSRSLCRGRALARPRPVGNSEGKRPELASNRLPELAPKMRLRRPVSDAAEFCIKLILPEEGEFLLG
jgi:hypothetical protein